MEKTYLKEDVYMHEREQILKDIDESISAINEELQCTTKDWFKRLAFEKWTLTEIRELILQKADISPSVVIEDFMYLMARYSQKLPPQSNYAFCVAYETALESV